jgi:hypothetical protein
MEGPQKCLLCKAAALPNAAVPDQPQILRWAVEEFAEHVNFIERYPVPNA